MEDSLSVSLTTRAGVHALSTLLPGGATLTLRLHCRSLRTPGSPKCTRLSAGSRAGNGICRAGRGRALPRALVWGRGTKFPRLLREAPGAVRSHQDRRVLTGSLCSVGFQLFPGFCKEPAAMPTSIHFCPGPSCDTICCFSLSV